MGNNLYFWKEKRSWCKKRKVRERRKIDGLFINEMDFEGLDGGRTSDEVR